MRMIRTPRSMLAAAMIVFAAPVLAQTDEPRTPGYWKNHSDSQSARYDVTWDQVGGPDQEFMGTGRSWLAVLQAPTNGNAYDILAHQYIAAQLNVLAGTLVSFEGGSLADATDIGGIVEHAHGLLHTNRPDSYLFESVTDSTGVELVKAAMRQDFINTALVLDDFNNSGGE